MATFWKKNKSKIKIFPADKWYSKKIRIRDAYANGYVCCCTCGKPGFWKYYQNGHFMSRKYWSTRFHDMNCNTQCPTCNMSEGGKQAEHAIYIDNKYGARTSEMLVNLAKISGGNKKPSQNELKILSNRFRVEFKKLAYKKGIEV
jgi:hypothetical protein